MVVLQVLSGERLGDLLVEGLGDLSGALLEFHLKIRQLLNTCRTKKVWNHLKEALELQLIRIRKPTWLAYFAYGFTFSESEVSITHTGEIVIAFGTI